MKSKKYTVDMVSGLKAQGEIKKGFVIALIVSSLLMIGSVVCQIIAPSILKELTNEIAYNALSHSIDIDFIIEKALILILIYALVAVSSYVSSYVMTTISQLLSMRLRTKITKKINDVPLSYFDSHQFGDILSRLTNDVDQIGQSLQQSVSMIVQSALLIIGVLIAMFVTSWQMALTTLISVPFMAVFLIIVTKFAMPQFRARQETLGDVNAVVEEDYNGQLVIKCFNAEEKVKADFERSNQALKNAMFKAQCFGGLMQPLVSFISYVAYAAVFVVGGLLVVNDPAFSYGIITEFMIYVNLFQSPLSQIAQAMNTMQMAAASSSRVFSFLNEKELEDESDKKYVFKDENGKEQVKGQVEFKNVCFSYDDSREIIHNFSAKISPGMKVAIVGPTGAGKTTLVNLLMRFYEVTSGEILIDGVSSKDMPREEMHDIFGMVLQDTWLFRGTIKENLVYNTKDVEQETIDKACKEANIAHYIKTLPGGYNYMLEDESSVSGGQKQLMTIARAMIKDAPLLILDEATSNVDTRTEEKIQEAMDRMTKGRTSFVIAHRLSTIKNADLILVMRNGNIVEQGTHDQLMAQNGFYASLYNSQFSFE
ncbi:MAG: ABC transporter ATP-binding protein [Firmicutes bacterium]|uniref:ABC transporter ATP-binding protein n=1 Tax=Candidatus Scatoplasma merdavium TaxID=2840932 RepID=A0A9D9GRR4_9BACL|nr:ABC transporter ATP-binding protein [Candidatus Scatoplasma merdavium]